MKEYIRQMRTLSLSRKKQKMLADIPKLLDKAMPGTIIKMNFLGLDTDCLVFKNDCVGLLDDEVGELKKATFRYKKLLKAIDAVLNINRKIYFLNQPKKSF